MDYTTNERQSFRIGEGSLRLELEVFYKSSHYWDSKRKKLV